MRTSTTKTPSILKKNDGWTDERRLSARFLESILPSEPYRGALTSKGVRILGAWFSDKIDLANVELKVPLWLDKSRLDAGADFTDARVNSIVSLDGSTVNNDLDMSRLRASSNVFLGDNAEYQTVYLTSARIDGELLMRASTFSGTLQMSDIRIGSNGRKCQI